MTKPDESRFIGSFLFDPECKTLRDEDDVEVPLRPQSARVLSVLVSRRGELVTKDDLMREVWADTHVTDDSLVQCISEIRKALGPVDSKLLVTVPKQGYRLNGAEASSEATNRKPRNTSSLIKMLAVTAAVIGLFLALVWLNREAPTPERTTIAVLPFVNISGDAEQNYLSVGLAEDLLTDLSKIGTLTVLSRSSTFSYRDMEDRTARITEAFDTTHLIDGSVQRDGNRIRISVRLVETATGENLWAERYDRRLGDIFQVQDELRARIVKALAVRLAPHEEERLRSGGTAVVSAYDLLLQGRYHETALTRDGVTRAMSLYRQAIDVDPGYGDAYARLANMYDFSSRFGWGESADADRTLALEMAERAIRLDPENPFAHWTLGRVLARLGSGADSRTRALDELQKAIDIDPNYADAFAFISLLHIGGGRAEDARKAINTAFRLNPEAPSWYRQNRGIISYFEDDFEAAAADFSAAADQNPTAHFTRLWLAAAYARTGDIGDAEWEIEEAVSLVGPLTVSEVLAANPIIRDASFQGEYAKGLKEAGLPE